MNWLLLTYKIPREPTASRVYVWRKLKQLGAESLQDAIWVLPATARTKEQFQWLAAEIVELNGEALVFQSQLVFAADGESLRQRFEAPVKAAYEEILAALKRRKPDLPALSKQFQQIAVRDFFQSELGAQVRRKLLAAGGDEA